jgi:hypothetical protein
MTADETDAATRTGSTMADGGPGNEDRGADQPGWWPAHGEGQRAGTYETFNRREEGTVSYRAARLS